MGRIIEGLWDCPYCGTKGNRGSVRECPCCGKPRGNDTKFYLPKEKNYLSDEEANKISKEPDWLCSFCDSYNSATTTVCHECGHTRDESDLNYFEKQKKNEEEKEKRERNLNINRNIDDSNIDDKKDDKSDFKKSTSKVRKNKFGFIGAGIAIVLLVLSLVYLFVPKQVDFVLSSIQWTHSQNIEEYRTINESDWSLPSGGRLLFTQQEISGYEEVLDHYETRTREVSEQVLDGYDTVVTGTRDLGNGYFEEITSQVPRYRTEYHTETYEEPVYRSEPIYSTKYYYEIDKWVFDRTITSSGTDKNIQYKEYVLEENERDSTFIDEYEFTGIIEEKEYTISVDKSTWDKYDVGDSIPAKINRLGIVSLVE